MGVALIPAAVLDTYTELARLSVHKLKGDFRTVKTLLIWRKDAQQPKVSALANLLRPAKSRTPEAPRAKRVGIVGPSDAQELAGGGDRLQR